MVTTSTFFFLNVSTISSSSFLVAWLKNSSAFLPALSKTSCCCLLSRSKLFFDISTGSYMTHSAVLPCAVVHLTCLLTRKATEPPAVLFPASDTPVHRWFSDPLSAAAPLHVASSEPV